jgi:hypothetical protein
MCPARKTMPRKGIPMDEGKVFLEGRIKVPYKWYAGETGSRFLIALRDNCEIWGTRCPKCAKVYVPPVKNCWECFKPIDEWVRIGGVGTVESYTIAYGPDEMFGLNPPVIYGLIKLEGASGSLLHFIGGVSPDKVNVGMKVKAVFSDRRSGSIMDIKYFAPSGE